MGSKKIRMNDLKHHNVFQPPGGHKLKEDELISMVRGGKRFNDVMKVLNKRKKR